jgi:hypothetical protein
MILKMDDYFSHPFFWIYSKPLINIFKEIGCYKNSFATKLGKIVQYLWQLQYSPQLVSKKLQSNSSIK